MRAFPLSTLPSQEQDQLIPRLGPDSGRASRVMTSVRARRGLDAVRCPVLCVSGASDRNVSIRTSQWIARCYGAEHHVHPDAPHWIVGESLLEQIAAPRSRLDQERRRNTARSAVGVSRSG